VARRGPQREETTPRESTENSDAPQSSLRFTKLSKTQRESLRVRDQNQYHFRGIDSVGQKEFPKSLSRELQPDGRPKIEQSLKAISANHNMLIEAHDRPTPMRVASLLFSST
jgi:hypothetical protein